MPPNDTSLYGPEEVRDWWKEYFVFLRNSPVPSMKQGRQA